MQLEKMLSFCCMEKKSPPTIIVTLTEKLQKPKEILSELIVLQYLGT